MRGLQQQTDRFQCARFLSPPHPRATLPSRVGINEWWESRVACAMVSGCCALVCLEASQVYLKLDAFAFSLLGREACAAFQMASVA